MAKANSLFKKRIAEQQKVIEEKRIKNQEEYEDRMKQIEKNAFDRSIINFNINEALKVKVERGNYFVSQEEIKVILEDIFNLGIKLNKEDIINTDVFCDVFYKINYKGRINEEEIFCLC